MGTRGSRLLTWVGGSKSAGVEAGVTPALMHPRWRRESEAECSFTEMQVDAYKDTTATRIHTSQYTHSLALSAVGAGGQ